MTTSVLALALMGVMHAPIQDTQLDLSVPGATLRTIGEEIGQKMGWEMIFDPSIENEVLVIRTKGQSAKDVIAQISEATGTRWTANGAKMMVQPDFQARERELNKARGENAKAILEAKQKFLDGLKPQKYKDENGEEFSYEPSEDRYLLGEMMSGLSDQFLTGVGPGQRIVLSSNPTPMQRPLGRFNAQRITEWIKKENEGRKISDEDRANMSADPEYQQYLEMFGMSIGDMMPKPIEEAPQKVLLILERPGRSEYDAPRVHVQLKVQGMNGKTLISTDAWLGGGDFEMGEFAVAATAASAAAVEGAAIAIGQSGEGEEAPEPRKPMPGDEIPMVQSEDAKAISDATKLDFQNPANMKMTPRARELMMRVDQYEPMRYELGEYLLEAADGMDKQLIAHLPDMMFSYGMEAPKKFGDVRDLFVMYGIEEKSDGNKWSINPTKRGKAWAKRVDRKALAGLLSEAQNRMFISLDTLATFKYQYPDSTENTISNQRLRIFAPSMEASLMGGMASDSLIRLYGSMNSAERQRLRGGNSLPIGSLSSAARGILNEMFFGYGGSLDAVDPNKDLVPSDPATSMSQMMGMGMMNMNNGGVAGSEPTDILPNGLPANGVVAMQVHQETYLLSVTKEGTVNPSLPPIGRLELAMVSMMMKNPQFLAEMDQYAEMLRNLRAGQRDNLHMVVLAAPQLGAKGVLVDPHDPDMTAVYGLQNLPAKLQEQMDSDREALEKSPMGKFFEMMGTAGFGGGGGAIRP